MSPNRTRGLQPRIAYALGFASYKAVDSEPANQKMVIHWPMTLYLTSESIGVSQWFGKQL